MAGRMVRAGAALLAVFASGADAAGQTLRSRIDATSGAIEFSFAAAPDVCGNERGWFRADGTGSGVVVFAGATAAGGAPPCEPGPVRVRLERDGGTVVAVRTTMGPQRDAGPATDLGRVAARAAVDYLLELAARAEGRVGRDAITAASLADSVQPFDGLLSLARNRSIARETRTASMSQLPRAAFETRARELVIDAMLALAGDDRDNTAVRRQALTTIGRLEAGAGVPALIRTSGGDDAWLTREATNVLAGSGDPRARARLREIARSDGAGDELRALAIRGLGQRYTTANDVALLREIHPRLRSAAARDAVVTALSTIGGADNVQWLLALAADAGEPVARRRRALDGAVRAGADVRDLVALYDIVGEQQLKDALVTTFGRSGERAAVDKLIAIARSETNVNVRRRAINTLSASDDPRVRTILLELIER